MTSEKTTILLVDDEPNNLRALRLDMEDTGYALITASDGMEAWEKLEEQGDTIAAILLDRMMPRMDGMAFMRQLKASKEFNNIPVIMQTAAAEKEQVAQGIEAGVYYYLTKPYDKQIMLSILRAAITDYGNYRELRKNLQQFKSKLNLVRNSNFEVKTLEDTEYLATFLAQFFPDPERVVFGISELVLNALEHGNLGITYDEKSALNNEGIWLDEVQRRQNLPEHANKVIRISYVRNDDSIELRIKDEGAGFDWKDYLEISPSRATDNHGRGIAMAKMMSFDDVTYTGCGNEVVCKTLLA